MDSDDDNTSKVPLWHWVGVLTRGRVNLGYGILLDLLGSHRSAVEEESTESVTELLNNVSTELMLRGRTAESISLVDLINNCGEECARVMLLSAFSSPPSSSKVDLKRNADVRMLADSAESTVYTLPEDDFSFAVGGKFLKYFCNPSHLTDAIENNAKQLKLLSSSLACNSPAHSPRDVMQIASTRIKEDAPHNAASSHDDILRDYVLEMCMGGTSLSEGLLSSLSSILNPTGRVEVQNGVRTQSNSIVKKLFLLRTSGSGKLSSSFARASAVGNVFQRVSAFVESSECDKEDKMMAAIRNDLLATLQGYVTAMDQARESKPANNSFSLLCETEVWFEELLHLSRVIEAIQASPNSSTSDVVDKISTRSGWYYMPDAVRRLTSLAVSLYFDELNEDTLWRQMDENNLDSSESRQSHANTLFGCRKYGQSSFPELLDENAVAILFRKWHSEKLLDSFHSAGKLFSNIEDILEDTPQCPISLDVQDSSSVDSPSEADVPASDASSYEQKQKQYFEVPPTVDCMEPLPRVSEDSFLFRTQRKTQLADANVSSTHRNRLDEFQGSAERDVSTLFLKKKFVIFEDIAEKLQSRLLDLFDTNCHVFLHLSNLFSLALLAAGDFANSLVTQINIASALSEQNEKFIRMRSEAGLTFYGATNSGSRIGRNNVHLQKCLVSALSASRFPDNLDAGIVLTTDGVSNAEKGLWEAPIQFHYRVQSPLNAVITEEYIGKYSSLFDFFLRLRRAKRMLHDIFTMTKGNSLLTAKSKSDLRNRRASVFLWQFCWQAHFFVDAVSEKTMQVVLRDSWINTIHKSRPVGSLLELNSRHHDFLSRSLRTCFLTAEHESVMGVLLGGFQVIVNVGKKVSQTSESNCSYTDIEDMMKGATASLKRRSAFFKDVLGRLGGIN